MDSYIGNRPINQVAGYRNEFIATAGQTVFTVSYAVGYVDVFLNGVKLASGDFTATDGTSVTLAEPATSGDVVAFISWAKGTMLPKEEFAPITRGRKNLLANGNFLVWQRGSPITCAAGATTYVADQWAVFCAGAAHSPYKSNTTREDGYGFALLANGVAGSTAFNILQRLESAVAVVAKNKNITLSGTIHSADARTITLRLEYPTTVDNFATRTLIASTTINVASGLNDFSWTVNAGENAGNGLHVEVQFGGITSGTGFGISKMQLEIGDEATDTEWRLYADELALCQRYLHVDTGNNPGMVTAGNIALIAKMFPVRMRATPGFGAGTSNGLLVLPNGGTVAVSSIDTPSLTAVGGRYRVTVASGLTSGDATIHVSQTLYFSAEL